MTNADRPVVITGNWKMYKTIEEGVAFVRELIPLVRETPRMVRLAVPFTLIKPLSDVAKGTNIVIGAQNMHDATEGAFTGEIAGKMLIDAGAKFVILGHSERRLLFCETNAFINRKVKRALSDGLHAVLCIGETLQQREENQTEAILKAQLFECLADVKEEQLTHTSLSYEPVWAVGTQAATPDIVEAGLARLREWLAEGWSESISKHMVIQYGGSVKPDNAKDFLDLPDVDGLLIGGASLDVESFSKIVNYKD